MVEAAQNRTGLDWATLTGGHARGYQTLRYLLTDPLMGAGLIEIRHIRA